MNYDDWKTGLYDPNSPMNRPEVEDLEEPEQDYEPDETY